MSSKKPTTRSDTLASRPAADPADSGPDELDSASERRSNGTFDRLADMIAAMDRRFEAMDRKFDALQGEINELRARTSPPPSPLLAVAKPASVVDSKRRSLAVTSADAFGSAPASASAEATPAAPPDNITTKAAKFGSFETVAMPEVNYIAKFVTEYTYFKANPYTPYSLSNPSVSFVQSLFPPLETHDRASKRPTPHNLTNSKLKLPAFTDAETLTYILSFETYRCSYGEAT